MNKKLTVRRIIAIGMAALTIGGSGLLLPYNVFDVERAVNAAAEKTGNITQMSDAAVKSEALVKEELEESYKAPGQNYMDNGLVVYPTQYYAGNSTDSSDDSSQEENNITWEINDDTLTISGSGKMQDYEYGSPAPWYDVDPYIKHIVIEEGITHLGKFAFYDYTEVETVSIPSTITSVGGYCFAEDRNLKSVVLPDAVKELPYAAFAECQSLESFTANGLTSIGGYALSNTKIKSFHVGSKLTSISNTAFLKASIEKFTADSSNTVYSAKDGVLYEDDGKTLFLYPCNKTDESFTIPSGVTKLGESSFLDAKLKKVIIPDSVESMGYFVFSRSYLTDVKFGKGLKAISYESFENCKHLENIDFGSGVETINNRAFAYCSAFKSLVLPENIKQISSASFGECSSLTSVKIYGVETIPFQAFMNCYSLTDVELVNTKSINRSAFAYCKSLNTITLPESVTYVHPYAFYRNDGKKTEITCLNKQVKPFGLNGYRVLQTVSIKTDKKYDAAWEVLAIVNEERANNGLDPLVMNESLLESAMQRAGECALNFSHTRPDSSSVFELNSLIYGENIAAGDTTAKGVMNTWMNSQGHKENILTKSFKTIGIGCVVHNGTYYWTQCFGSSSDTADCAKPANSSSIQSVSFAIDEFSDAVTGNSTQFSSGSQKYHFTDFKVDVPSKVEEESKVTASVYVGNAGASYLSAKLENDSNIKWKSSDEKIAKVNSKGVITGVTNGNAEITAYTDFYSSKGSIAVTKKPVYAESVSLSKTSVTLEKGKTYTLTATVNPDDAVNKQLEWKTGNTAVATVENGKIKAVGTGRVTIAARTSNGKTATCRVTVVDKLVNKSVVNASKVGIGDDIRISGAATGGSGDYQYAFYFKRSTNTKWNLIADFGAKKVANLIPTAQADYDIKVIAKDKTGLKAEKTFKVSAVKDLPLNNTSTISAETVAKGNSVKLYGRSLGGEKAVKYQFFFKREANSVWHRINAADENATSAKLAPTAAGVYDLKVVAIDANGKKAEKLFKLKVK